MRALLVMRMEIDGEGQPDRLAAESSESSEILEGTKTRRLLGAMQPPQPAYCHELRLEQEYLWPLRLRAGSEQSG